MCSLAAVAVKKPSSATAHRTSSFLTSTRLGEVRSDAQDLLQGFLRFHAGERGHRIEGFAGALDAVLLVGDLLRQEDRVQLAALRGPDQVEVQVRRHVVGRLAIAGHPGAQVDPDAVHQRRRQDHLLLGHLLIPS
jgi:hypothetical protein